MTIAEATALGGLAVTIVVLAWQTKAKRADDKRAAQLQRLGKQLSDLYGPLYALYEAGERNWLQFVATHSHDTRKIEERGFLPDVNDTYPPPNAAEVLEYRRRMEELFMPTNLKMEAAITTHADLIVGTRMPDAFADLLAHVAAANLLVQRWRKAKPDEFGPERWADHHIEYGHPRNLKHLIRASFEVLKDVQQQMLSGRLATVNEADIEALILQHCTVLESQWDRGGLPYVAQLDAHVKSLTQLRAAVSDGRFPTDPDRERRLPPGADTPEGGG
jgi:hypothetical protein